MKEKNKANGFINTIESFFVGWSVVIGAGLAIYGLSKLWSPEPALSVAIVVFCGIGFAIYFSGKSHLN